MTSGWTLVLSIAVTLSTAAAEPGGRQTLQMQAGDQLSTLHVEDTFILGPGVQLAWTDGEVHGTVTGRNVFLQLDARSADGLIGAGPTWFYISSRRSQLQVEGTMIATPLKLEVSDDAVLGPVGACLYDLLSVSETRYEGKRVCSGEMERVWLELPPAFLERPGPLEVTALVLLLGMGS